ncbi:MAG: sulfotransferase [Pseudomonadota bacterium]|nr:sulfotransferase [Pseudomonadota bacterium]
MTAPIMPPNGISQFLLVGPLRTGSSLLSRCIDDHPNAICLCETDINRALFDPFAVAQHFLSMERHGFAPYPILQLLDGRRQCSIADWRDWYSAILPMASDRYGKPAVRALGDKSPDFFTAPALVEAIASADRLIYTVRHPKAILRSIWRQDDATELEKKERWEFLKSNIRCWKPHWDRPNLLIVRYEDLLGDPVHTMSRVYAHLGLPPSERFLEPFARSDPERFLWPTAVDWTSGIGQRLDPARADVRPDDLSSEQLAQVFGDPDIQGFMDRFGYE